MTTLHKIQLNESNLALNKRKESLRKNSLDNDLTRSDVSDN